VLIAVVALLASLAPTSPSRAADAQQFVLDATLALSQVYPAGAWVPVRLTATNKTDRDVRGFIVIPVAAPATPATFRVPMDVPAGSRVQRWAMIYLPEPPAARGNRRDEASTRDLAMVEWVTADGAMLSRLPILGRPDSAPKPGASAGSAGLAGTALVAINDRSQEQLDDPNYTSGDFAIAIEDALQRPVASVVLTPDVAPTLPAAYESARFVLLDGAAASSLTPPQRDALLGHVRAGGVLIVAGLTDYARQLAGTWLEPLLPVDVVGSREATELALSEPAKTTVKLPRLARVDEAVARDGATVVWRDANYVHAAFATVGRGRVAFLSVPAGALTAKSRQRTDLLRRLLDLPAADAFIATRFGGPTSEAETARSLRASREQLITTMIGTPAPAWRWAAVAAGTLVAGVVVLQLLIGGARRPLAFVASSAFALLMAAVLVGAARIGRGDEQLAAARLGLTDVGVDGQGIRREVIGVVGRDVRDLSIAAADDRATVAPSGARGEPPTLIGPPVRVPDAGARALMPDLLWSAEQPATSPLPRATLAFDAQGARVTFDPAPAAGALDDAMVTFQSRAMPLGDATGPSARVGPAGPRGNYTPGAAVLGNERARRRGQLVAWAYGADDASVGLGGTSAADELPSLVAFAEPQPPLLSVDPAPQWRSESAIRAALAISPTPPNTPVRFDPGFVRFLHEAARGAPYDASRGGWQLSTQGGDYLLGFLAPWRAGEFKPGKIIVAFSARLPVQSVAFRRGQVRGGVAGQNQVADPIASFPAGSATQTFSFDVGPDDVDADGVVWLLMSVTGPATPTLVGPREWLVEQLDVTLDGTIVGPPKRPAQVGRVRGERDDRGDRGDPGDR
jgi:hypothetical protein